MKKSLVLLLCALLCVCAFTGCTQTAGPEAAEPTAAPAVVPTAAPTAAPVGAAEAVVEEAAPYTYADTIAWDGEYDVVVIGYGGAGANASIAAADAGASVLLTEKAPKGEEGGNTRYSGQFTLISYDADATLTYLKGLAGGRAYNEAVLKTFAQGLTEIEGYYEEVLGAQGSTATEIAPAYANHAREFKEYEGWESVDWYLFSMTGNDAAAWNLYRQNVADRSDKIDVWYSSPALHLIQDPISKTILGVQIDKDGELVNIRATNGVVMACGGFENNEEMKTNYLGISNMKPVGTIYNTGDGIIMAQEVGARLWHMSNWAATGVLGNYCVDTDGAEDHAAYIISSDFVAGASVLVGIDGTRFLAENNYPRHGQTSVGGEWTSEFRPSTAYYVCDATKFEHIVSSGLLAERHVKYATKYATLEDMAAELGTTELVNTIAAFNGYAAEGFDPQFGRDPATMSAFSTEGPYYAIKMQPHMLNTQGGAERNENAQVISLSGEPIPHLYSAGEFGSITVKDYNGGGNIAECIVFGRIAGVNAAAEKAPLPAYTLAEPVVSSIRYTLGCSDNVAAEYETTEHQYIGTSPNGMGGDVVVRVTFADGAISNVEILSHNETEGISDKAIAEMPGRIIASNSAEVDTCAGCTVTSKAIIQAVQNAIENAN